MSIQKIRATRRVFRCFLPTAAVIAALPALAADEAAVLVSGNRFGAGAEQVAAGVSVISAADIARSSATTIPEVLVKLGGMHVRNNAGDPNWQVDLRGFGITGDQNTLILLDGQRISENELATARLTAIPLNAIERIEILRGTGAVLYGSGATGGTVNIVTRAPGAEGKAFALGASYGTYDTAALRANLEFNVGPVGVMLSANRHASDNYRQNNHVNEKNVEGALRYRGAGSELNLKFGTGRQALGLPGARTEAQLASAPRAATNPNDHAETDTWHAGIGGRFSFGNNEFSAELDVRNRQVRSDFVAFAFLSETATQRVSFTPRLRLPHAGPGGAGELVVGWDNARWNYRQTNNFGGLTIASQDSDALYAQERLRVLPGTLLTGGVRWQRSLDGTAAVRRTTRLDAWELGLRQELTAQLSAYGRTGSSFRLATVDENVGLAAPLLPQESRDSEVGMEFGGGANRLRAAWFLSNLDNEIHFIPFPAFGTPPFFGGANTNLSPTRRTGIELEGHWRALPKLDLAASLRQMRATFRSGTYGGIDVTGKDVPLVPERMLSLNATWRIGSGRQLTGNLRHVGEQRYDNDQINAFRKMPAYGLVDVKYSHAMGSWTWALAVDNLFDKRHYSYAITNSAVAPTSFSAYPELGRRLMVSAELRL
ncbi:TonB-dependent receptor [Sulfuritalea sp.]|uniref:TonB-dependent receptor n=1 Tax=Sulfuritalea sp. TaxID=2480090 RepID=UPI001AC8110F|nr:TonB-dependent receptor [Sulfuritalea sp.]MBN8475837.1 TonB-dependent receptor [Sulfuritalea sp.]